MKLKQILVSGMLLSIFIIVFLASSFFFTQVSISLFDAIGIILDRTLIIATSMLLSLLSLIIAFYVYDKIGNEYNKYIEAQKAAKK